MIQSKYILKPDIRHQIDLKQRLDKYGIEYCFDDIYPWLDCTKIIDAKKGWRKNQTINIYYRIKLGEILYILQIYEGDDKELYLNKIEERHNNNLKFEEINPPIDYDKRSNYGKRKSTNKVKQDSAEKIAERRREKVTKITKGFKFVFNANSIQEEQ